MAEGFEYTFLPRRHADKKSTGKDAQWVIEKCKSKYNETAVHAH